MYKSLERSMTDEERKRLLDCMPLAPSAFRARSFKLTLIAEGLGVFLAVSVLVWFKKEPASFVIPAAFGLYALWWLLHLRNRVLKPLRRSREANQQVREFRSAVNTAQSVRVCCVESEVVVQVTHDEGTICLFDVGDKRTYWIDPYCGMTPGHPAADWPNRKFEVVRVPGWKKEIGPFCCGKRLRVRDTIEFRDLFEHYDFQPPKDGLIYHSIDTFLTAAAARNHSATGASAT